MALTVCVLCLIGYYTHTDEGGPRLIFLLVGFGYIWGFMGATVVAVVLNHISGAHQKVSVAFAALVYLVLWLGNEPYAEPFPGALEASVLIATMLQLVFAWMAFIVRDRSCLTTECDNR